MENDDSNDETPTMLDLLKLHKFQKTSKRVWKLDRDLFIITFVGIGPDASNYDIRIRIIDTDNFEDNTMRVLWKELRDNPDPVGDVVRWAELNAIDDVAPGFMHEVVVGEKTQQLQISCIHNPNRLIRIYTWGIAKRARKPDDSQRNWFVGTITTRAHGVDLSKFDGRSSEVQGGIAQDPKFNKIMDNIVSTTENENLTCISISCTKGRHRSVAVAELLRLWFYPLAEVVHLTIPR